MGISDLNKKLIRTPLKAIDTFTDDPLRLIRCIRFANKFDFSIVPEIIEAAKNP
jgi:tRNA nucleotidyltransferase (CCA-adding enzyme)